MRYAPLSFLTVERFVRALIDSHYDAGSGVHCCLRGLSSFLLSLLIEFAGCGFLEREILVLSLYIYIYLY
jgi:hypothetical protein